MKPFSNFVSLHPYFKVHPGKLEIFTEAFPGFVASRVRSAMADFGRARKDGERRGKIQRPVPKFTSGWLYLS